MQTETINLSTELLEGSILFLDGFERAVLNTPNAIAVIHEDQQWTFEELSQYANRFASFILGRNPERQQRIGLCVDKSGDAIAAMLGILRAGCVFVPLDPDYPSDRLLVMVCDAGIECIFCDPAYRSRFSVGEQSSRFALVDLHDEEIVKASREKIAVEISGDDLAYIMYTSGSTGNPKGVEIQHRALAAYCGADIQAYQLTADDRTLQFSSLSFDIAIEEIFPPLLAGGSVVVRPRQRSSAENELSAIVDEYQITALHLATAYWHAWVDLMDASHQQVPQSLRMVLATGEKVSPTHYAKWKSLCRHEVLWCNAYGPTETTVTATVFVPSDDWSGESMPIGKPLAGYTAYILDGGDRPLGIGETGDLYIGGPALARGYRNLPQRTAEVFRTVMLPDKEGQLVPTRIYKTGDLARWLPSGDIEFAGRIDHQIKLGSYRIEPGEIEYHLNCHPQVLESLAVVDQRGGNRVLVAHVAVGDRQVSATELAEFLRDRLPTFMLPSCYCFCTAFPKTVNGKIDRQRLPSAEAGIVPRSEEYDAPRNPLEQKLVDLWEDVLGVSRLGIRDDFFACGGSSLLVTRVIAGLREQYDLAIPVRDFFANPTVASLAAMLGERLQLNLPSDDAEEQSRELRSRLPKVEAFFFSSGTNNLFAVHYRPVPLVSDKRLTSEKRHGVLVCTSDGHEYQRVHRNLQQLSLQLAAAGFDVLRFDYSGCGNSSGENSEGRVDTWISEIGEAANVFRQRANLESLSVLGVRLGATLAINANVPGVSKLILWDPVIQGGRYVELLERLHQQSLQFVIEYPQRRTTQLPQLYGVEMPAEKRVGFQQLRLPATFAELAASEVVLITSRDYFGESLSPEWMSQVRCYATSDEIYWDRPEFTQSAFSSPQFGRIVLQVLEEEEVSR